MTRPIIIILLSLLVRPCFSQSFLSSYKAYCINKIDSSILQQVMISSDLIDLDKTNKRINSRRKQLNDRLNYQLEKFTIIFNSNNTSTGFDFNEADSLTIIYQTNNKSSFANFIIISGKDTLKSSKRLALVREVNNSGGKLEPLKKGATEFRVYKSSNDNIPEPFLELASKSDTANAFESDIYCPVDIGPDSIIITAKKINGSYRIWDYYLHEFRFVAISKEK